MPRQLFYHIYSIWLFTRSDLKTFLFPSTLFAATHAYAAHRLQFVSRNPLLDPVRVLQAFLWVYITLLPFNIANQCQEEAIAEDKLNKPWRSLPSGRMSPASAKRLMVVLYSIALLISFTLGAGLTQNILLLFLGTWYNFFGGADQSFAIRNLINAFGFLSFSTGALDVFLSGFAADKLGSTFTLWYLVIGGIVLSTIQTQDMYDQEGDRQRGRETMPLAIGDRATRWITSVLVLCWSVVAPSVWQVSMVASVPTLLLGIGVAARSIALRTVPADRRTFQLWNLWLSSLYVLPMVGLR